MSGTVLTLSPRMPLDRAERIVRGRVERDGVAALSAASSDRRQVAQLRRLAGRLADLAYHLGEHGDGTTSLIVLARRDRPVAWRGDAKVG